MRNLKQSLIILATVGLCAACSSNSNKEENVAMNNQKSGLVCTKEKVMGSNIPKKICRTESQMAAEKEAAQRMMSKQRGLGGQSEGTGL